MLEFERGGGFSAHSIWHDIAELRTLIKDTEATISEPLDSIRRKLSRIEIDLKSLEISELRILSSINSGGNPGAESSVMKLTTTRLKQEVNQLATEVIAYQGLVVADADNIESARPDFVSSIVPRYLNNRAASIFGGSQEVQKNIIAKVVLGL